MFIGSFHTGNDRSRAVPTKRARGAALVAVLVFALSGCGLLSIGESPPGQSGSTVLATHAADAFLRALARHDADEAWSHLTPATRHVVYDDVQMTFAQDVAAADWSGVAWEFGPVTDLDTSWGVHIIVDEDRVPAFLVKRDIAAGSEGFGIVLLVQTPEAQSYLIAGRSQDLRAVGEVQATDKSWYPTFS